MRVLLPDVTPLPIGIDIVSKTPGRIRLRVAPEHRQAEQLDKIADTLKTFISDLKQIRTNGSSGSLTIYYDPEKLDFEEILAILRRLGVILDETADVSSMPIRTSASTTAALASPNPSLKQTLQDSVELRPLLFLLTFFLLRRFLPIGTGWKTILLYVLASYLLEGLFPRKP